MTERQHDWDSWYYEIQEALTEDMHLLQSPEGGYSVRGGLRNWILGIIMRQSVLLDMVNELRRTIGELADQVAILEKRSAHYDDAQTRAMKTK